MRRHSSTQFNRTFVATFVACDRQTALALSRPSLRYINQKDRAPGACIHRDGQEQYKSIPCRTYGTVRWCVVSTTTITFIYRRAVGSNLPAGDPLGGCWEHLLFQPHTRCSAQRNLGKETLHGPFLRCHLYVVTIVLPRQARDNHRESTQKRSGVSSGRRE